MNLKDIITSKGIPSFCTSNTIVLKSLLNFCKNKNLPILVETTSNQVNQYGGYSRNKPKDFIKKMTNLVNKINFNKKNIFYGGDHLGPLPWKKNKSGKALKNSIKLIDSYLKAKYSKIHIDTSIKCSDDKSLSNNEVFLRAKFILRNLRKKNLLKKVFLVFGTEVPLSGGNDNKKIKATNLKQIHEEYENFFKLLKSENFPTKNFGIVIEPGMKFMHRNITKPNLKNFEIKKLFSKKNKFVFEAHSSDYQSLSTLKKLVKNNFKILKVGPELTFYLFKSLLFMEKIEKKFFNKRSDFKKIILTQMFNNKKYWKEYFKPTNKMQLKKNITTSLFDRTRYYLEEKNIIHSLAVLEKNINKINQKEIIQLLTQRKKTNILQKSKDRKYKNFDLINFYYLNEIFIKYYKACGFNIPR
jgi:D-tagatose-1,6-bisphosphate aldolase subunit GatZ/KbaZ